jgi:hypothetical protein
MGYTISRLFCDAFVCLSCDIDRWWEVRDVLNCIKDTAVLSRVDNEGCLGGVVCFP